MQLSHRTGSDCKLHLNSQERTTSSLTAGNIESALPATDSDNDEVLNDDSQLLDSSTSHHIPETAVGGGVQTVALETATFSASLPNFASGVPSRTEVKEEDQSYTCSSDTDSRLLTVADSQPSHEHHQSSSLVGRNACAFGKDNCTESAQVSGSGLCSFSSMESGIVMNITPGFAEDCDIRVPCLSPSERTSRKSVKNQSVGKHSDVEPLKAENTERGYEGEVVDPLTNSHWADTVNFPCQHEMSKDGDLSSAVVEALNQEESQTDSSAVETGSEPGLKRRLRSSKCGIMRSQESRKKKQFSFHKPASSLKKKKDVDRRKPTQSTTSDRHEDPLVCSVCNKRFSHKKTLRCHMFIHTGERPYVCDICNVGFRQSSNLRNHMKTIHTAEKQVMCQHCPFTCKTNKSLKQHIILRHSGPLERTFQCRDCSATFITNSHLQRHRLTHSGEKPYVCEDCGQAFSQKCNLKKHVAGTHHKSLDGNPIKFVKKFMCDICGKTFFAQTSLVQHKVRHTSVRPFNCELCSKSFKTLPVLKQHQRNLHIDSGPYPCKVCDKYFGTKAARNSHMKAHSGNKPFVCGNCGRGFRFEHQLLSHELTHSDSKLHVCDICEKNFKTKFALNQHKQTHLANTEFLCETCGKSFKTRRSLRLHEATHSESRQHVCEICEKSFKTNIALYSHKVTHTDHKNFICETCGKAFKRRSELKKHEARHSESRPHTCEMCEKSFKTKYCLQSHRQTHTDHKSFICETCGKVYKSRPSLLNHEATHSDSRPHTCEICEKSFISSPSLKRHMLLHNRAHLVDQQDEEEQMPVGSGKACLAMGKAQVGDHAFTHQ